MDITLEKVDQVRERTGVSYAEAKNALEISNGDVLNAIILLEEKSKYNNSNEANKSETVDEFKTWLKDLINKLGFNCKVVSRKNNFVVYLKESEQISDLLSIIGAHNALLSLQNTKIVKAMRNNVNRIVNCETANLSKTVNASVRQIENIKLIQDTIGISSLPENLQEIARIRLECEDMTLKELGEMLEPPIGKSGVNHRLRKIEEIANDLRSKQE